MISIPYGKLFYLQAACQTKQQKQKGSSALRRNNTLKNKVRTPFFFLKSISDSFEDQLTTENGMQAQGTGRRGRHTGKQKGNYGKGYPKKPSTKLDKNKCFHKNS